MTESVKATQLKFSLNILNISAPPSKTFATVIGPVNM